MLSIEITGPWRESLEPCATGRAVELVQAGELFISAALQLQTVPANLRLVEQSTNEVEVERTPRVPVPRAPCDPYSRSAGA